MGCGSVMGRWSLPFVLHALKIINWVFCPSQLYYFMEYTGFKIACNHHVSQEFLFGYQLSYQQQHKIVWYNWLFFWENMFCLWCMPLMDIYSHLMLIHPRKLQYRQTFIQMDQIKIRKNTKDQEQPMCYHTTVVIWSEWRSKSLKNGSGTKFLEKSHNLQTTMLFEIIELQ